jgi:hypothetical protein
MGGEWSTPLPGCFTPEKELVGIAKGTRWAKGPVRADAENLVPRRDSNIKTSSPWRDALPAHIKKPKLYKYYISELLHLLDQQLSNDTKIV